MMKASVVIRSKDEADRLRLTLTSLANQTLKAEVIVVNDGSSDHTREVVDEAAQTMDLVAIHHAQSTDRSAASNEGAEEATGDVVIFLDGDTLAHPELVARHLAQHQQFSDLIVRGETWHIRHTRQLLNPETGTPQPGQESQVAQMSESDRTRSLVTRQQIRDDFGAIERRARPGIYPGFGPGKLYELEMDALRNHPGCEVLWAAASGHNLSVARSAFLEIGGFNTDISIDEHRRLALRLCRRGLRMMATSARSFHLIHRSGWRDPLQENTWEEIFYRSHPIPEVALLSFFWASLSDRPAFPPQACLRSLPELAAAARRYRGLTSLEAVREAHLRWQPGLPVDR
jgi:glycosyltransferase involved in cell wall biosynthesis